ncbi:hypothetical protein NP493_1029g04011 [Ridgeia piscesae]|uniref:Uncharacterized protein n=1 Tax=Ridgeia piscesae TaxID=27915 RepID=A0AAD9KHL1_RIDPI|nr:hypothetical protein NP493_1029g04011 [Ridgeia piscesae]
MRCLIEPNTCSLITVNVHCSASLTIEIDHYQKENSSSVLKYLLISSWFQQTYTSCRCHTPQPPLIIKHLHLIYWTLNVTDISPISLYTVVTVKTRAQPYCFFKPTEYP